VLKVPRDARVKLSACPRLREIFDFVADKSSAAFNPTVVKLELRGY
jgi:hypothetical protein